MKTLYQRIAEIVALNPIDQVPDKLSTLFITALEEAKLEIPKHDADCIQSMYPDDPEEECDCQVRVITVSNAKLSALQKELKGEGKNI